MKINITKYWDRDSSFTRCLPLVLAVGWCIYLYGINVMNHKRRYLFGYISQELRNWLFRASHRLFVTCSRISRGWYLWRYYLTSEFGLVLRVKSFCWSFPQPFLSSAFYARISSVLSSSMPYIGPSSLHTCVENYWFFLYPVGPHKHIVLNRLLVRLCVLICCLCLAVIIWIVSKRNISSSPVFWGGFASVFLVYCFCKCFSSFMARYSVWNECWCIIHLFYSANVFHDWWTTWYMTWE